MLMKVNAQDQDAHKKIRQLRRIPFGHYSGILSSGGSGNLSALSAISCWNGSAISWNWTQNEENYA